MRKRKQEALRRLEEALLQDEYRDERPEHEPDILQQTWQEDVLPDGDYEVYNTDDTDVDMDAYSEDVRRGPSGNALPVLLVVFTVLLLGCVIALLLRIMGVF